MAEIEYIRPGGYDCVIRVVTGEVDPYLSMDAGFTAAHGFMIEVDPETQEPRWKKLADHVLRRIPPSDYLMVRPNKSQAGADHVILQENPESLPPVSFFPIDFLHDELV